MSANHRRFGRFWLLYRVVTWLVWLEQCWLVVVCFSKGFFFWFGIPVIGEIQYSGTSCWFIYVGVVSCITPIGYSSMTYHAKSGYLVLNHKRLVQVDWLVLFWINFSSLHKYDFVGRSTDVFTEMQAVLDKSIQEKLVTKRCSQHYPFSLFWKLFSRYQWPLQIQWNKQCHWKQIVSAGKVVLHAYDSGGNSHYFMTHSTTTDMC